MKLDPELLNRLELLKQQFKSGLPQRLDRIDTALDACADDPANPTAHAALATALHSLGGAAGIFGFGQLGVMAREAEREVMAWVGQGGTDEQIQRLRSLALSWRMVE